jgi:hypothetical protein
MRETAYAHNEPPIAPSMLGKAKHIS